VSALAGDDPGRGLTRDRSGKVEVKLRAPMRFDEGDGITLFVKPPLAARQAIELDFEAPLVAVKNKLGVKPADPVADLATGAAVATVVTKVNELLQALRDGGFLKT
jgi:hypothetical protein